MAQQAQRDDLVLLCWCKKAHCEVPCHGDVIQAAIRWLQEKDR
ncbi:MAG: hypothetical protein U0Y68_24500 [Blastocatellia bacterium]